MATSAALTRSHQNHALSCRFPISGSCRILEVVRQTLDYTAGIIRRYQELSGSPLA